MRQNDFSAILVLLDLVATHFALDVSDCYSSYLVLESENHQHRNELESDIKLAEWILRNHLTRIRYNMER